MERTRAERRRKLALIKKEAWDRSVWKRIAAQGSWKGKDEVSHFQECYRRGIRNEGKWRHPGTKKWHGCGPDCGYCNPDIRCEWRDKSILKSEMILDVADFYSATSEEKEFQHNSVE